MLATSKQLIYSQFNQKSKLITQIKNMNFIFEIDNTRGKNEELKRKTIKLYSPSMLCRWLLLLLTTTSSDGTLPKILVSLPLFLQLLLQSNTL